MAGNKIIDKFFDLGNKATKGSPVRKAQFDYTLYWIVFLVFISISINYVYNFFFKDAPISQLMWGIVVAIFCWFNYWALISFRQAYLNIKKFYDKSKEQKPINEDPFEDKRN